MKTDRYKDWESRFFDGEPLTPEEELFLKNESDNPYFSFLKDEKTEKLDLSFEEFLKKTEQPEEIKVIPIKKKTIPMMYWLAASLVIMFGLVLFWMQPTAQDAEKQIAHQNVVKDDVAEKSSIEKPIGSKKVNEVNEVAIAKTEIKHKNSQKQQNNELGQHNVYLADYQFKEKGNNQKLDKNGISDYNPNYVIINGKPVYNEQEAIAITEDTFNYFASNVSQTITEAENAQNMSKDLYNIINF